MKAAEDILQQVLAALAELVGAPPIVISASEDPEPGEFVAARAGSSTFLIEWARSGKTGPVSLAAGRVRAAADRADGAIPLVAAPYMGEVGRRLCDEAGVAWLDLSGNAHIVAEGLRVVVSGRPNRFKGRGRPTSVFARKSSRIARWLLMHPDRAATQTEIANATDMDRGFTSRIVSRLIEDGLVIRERDGRLRVPAPGLLLDAWRETYDFTRHRIIRGHVATRSGDALLGKLTADLREQRVEHAATGLSAAWVLSRFAAFRITTLYLATEPPDALLSNLAFREEPRGANVWLVVPNDEGVFHGAEECHGVRCVHPVQAYLDLKGHPERAEEAAALLRHERLSWRTDA